MKNSPTPELAEDGPGYAGDRAVLPALCRQSKNLRHIRFDVTGSDWSGRGDCRMIRLLLPAQHALPPSTSVLLYFQQDTFMIRIPFVYHERTSEIRIRFRRRKNSFVLSFTGDSKNIRDCNISIHVLALVNDRLVKWCMSRVMSDEAIDQLFHEHSAL